MTAEVALSVDEEQDLASFEETISNGLRTFVEVGEALAAVRDRKLYRQVATSFEAYCELQWGISRRRAYDLMGSAETVRELSAIAHTPLPENEGQARALSGLEPGVAAEVMTAAAEAGPVTARSIAEHREQIAPRPMPVAKVTDSTKTETFVNTDTGEVLPSPVDEWLDSDQAVQDKSYLTKFSGALSRADDFLAFDAERIAELANEHHMKSLDHLVDQITNYREKVRRARSGLRVIQGGNR